MPTLSARLETAVSLVEVDSDLFHDIVHGGITDVVVTEGGTVPSVAKAIHDALADYEEDIYVNYFAGRTAAKAATVLVPRRTYYIQAEDGFLPGNFLYDSTSTATADNSDVLALDTLAGRLTRLF